MTCKQGRTEGASRISRGRLNPDVFKPRLAQDSAIADAVERHTPGKAKVAHPAFPTCGHTDPQHRLLGNRTDRCRDVHIPLRKGGFRLPRLPAEESGETFIGHGKALTVIEIVHVQPERAVFTQVDEVIPDQ